MGEFKYYCLLSIAYSLFPSFSSIHRFPIDSERFYAIDGSVRVSVRCIRPKHDAIRELVAADVQLRGRRHRLRWKTAAGVSDEHGVLQDSGNLGIRNASACVFISAVDSLVCLVFCQKMARRSDRRLRCLADLLFVIVLYVRRTMHDRFDFHRSHRRRDFQLPWI